MSFGSGEQSEEQIEVIFEKVEVESIEDPPEEWSSLFFESETNLKKIQYEQGLYTPGSGEICTKYLSMSASSVFRHVYYKYPAILDPGIERALLAPIPSMIYPDDGQELYLDLCKEMSIAPIRSFYRSLLGSTIDLSYYGIDTKGFRAIFLALRMNKFIDTLILTDNFMSRDACFHLGDMLPDNSAIRELNLSGCRVGPLGSEALCHFLCYNTHLKKIDFSRNQLGDEGFEYLTKAMMKGISVLEFNLSYNNLSTAAIASLIEVLEIRNKLTSLNLSWNVILSPAAIQRLCQELSKNDKFEMLNLSWNFLSSSRIGMGIKTLMQRGKSIKTIILNNNKLSDESIKIIASGLLKPSKTFHTLDLSDNPMSPKDATLLLAPLKRAIVKVQCLLLDNVIVNEEFMQARQEILALKFRKTCVITHGYVNPTYVLESLDIKYLLLKRVDALSRASKKAKSRVDFALAILQMKRDDPQPKILPYFERELRDLGLNLPADLLEQIAIRFAGPRGTDKNKSRTVNLDALIEFNTRLWPDKKLPPTPPPEPEPEPEPIPEPPPKKKKGKK